MDTWGYMLTTKIPRRKMHDFFAQIQHCNYSLLTVLGRALSCPRVMFLIVWPALLGFLAMMNGEE